MKKRIDGKHYDTETSENLGTKYAGAYGDADGFEEQLFVNRKNQHFIYGAGGPESKYKKPNIILVTEKEAQDWLKSDKIK